MNHSLTLTQIRHLSHLLRLGTDLDLATKVSRCDRSIVTVISLFMNEAWDLESFKKFFRSEKVKSFLTPKDLVSLLGYAELNHDKWDT